MSTLDEIARKYGTDKRTNDPEQNIYHGYTLLYEKYFEQIRNEPINLLEIGIREGWSHLMWNEYFPNANIFGIDNFSDVIFSQITVELEKLKKDRLFLFCGDATNEIFVNSIFDELSLDIIIDDASHQTDQQVKSFQLFFPKLKLGGYYFIEDLDINQQNSFISMFGGELLGELGLIRK
jgi:cephalosporin hydroxylase